MAIGVFGSNLYFRGLLDTCGAAEADRSWSSLQRALTCMSNDIYLFAGVTRDEPDSRSWLARNRRI
jgi:hypothetical protein